MFKSGFTSESVMACESRVTPRRKQIRERIVRQDHEYGRRAARELEAYGAVSDSRAGAEQAKRMAGSAELSEWQYP